VIFCVGVAVAIVGISIVAGVTQPIDPRVIATEPLSDRDRAIGLLAAAASGPPGLCGCLIGLGLVVGATRGASSLMIVVPTVLAWLLTLLLLTRTATNALGLLSNRLPRIGQVIVGLSGLVFYGAFQVIPAALGDLDRGDRDRIARVISFNPLGQLGRALGAADDSVRVAAGHLVLGALWLPILAAAFQSTTHALTVSIRGGRSSMATTSTSNAQAPSTMRKLVRRACGTGGAVKDLIAGMNDVPKEVAEIAAGLPYRDYMTVGLLVPKLNLKNKTKMKTIGNIVPDDWVYVHDRSVMLGRFQIYNNWSPYMIKDLENTVWVGLEYFVFEGDKYWSMSDDDFAKFAIDEFVRMGVIDQSSDVMDYHVERVKKAYPAYFDTYAQMDTVVESINKFDNIYCVGRNGQHRYNNIDHSMMTSFETVDNIISGRKDKKNIWNVNTEKEYHEASK
jgi:hypothetical protein